MISTNLHGDTFDKDSYYNDVILDFTTADNKLDGNDDVLVANVADDVECGRNATSNVPLNFSHLLCNVQFRFYADTEETAYFLKILSVRLLKIHVSGQVSLDRNSKNDPWEISWLRLTDPETIEKGKPGGGEIVPLLGSTDDPPTIEFFLPPQKATGNFFRIYFYYISEGLTSDKQIYLKAKFKDVEWQSGNQYIYNVSCKMLPHIEFNVSYEDGAEHPIIDEWEVESEITLPYKED